MADAKIAVLIESEVKRGAGTIDSRIRAVRRFSDQFGTFIAENDPWDLGAKVRDIVDRAKQEGDMSDMTFRRLIEESVKVTDGE